jgi:hypothetical protein
VEIIKGEITSKELGSQAECPRMFLDIIGQNPGVSKSNRLCGVVIIQFFSINLKYIP